MIIDDEPETLELIRSFVCRAGQVRVVATECDPLNALKRLRRCSVDFLILDVEMPRLNGLELIAMLKTPTRVILCTGHARFALDGYDVQAVDFLLKPLSYPRFQRALRRVAQTWQSGDEPARGGAGNYVFLRDIDTGECVQLNLAEIIYVEALRNYMKVITSAQTYRFRITLSALSAHLPAWQFLRVHRSFIINRKYVRFVDRQQIHLDISGESDRVPIGRKYRHVSDKLANTSYHLL